MMKLTGILALLLLLGAGCDRLFWVGMSPDSTPDKPVFLLGNSDDLSGSALIYSATVSGRLRVLGPGDSLNSWHTCWAIEKDSGFPYVEVSNITYGIVPSSFHLVSGPESLPAGRLYFFAPQFHGLGRDAYFEIYLDSSGTRAIRGLTEDQFQAIIHDTLGR